MALSDEVKLRYDKQVLGELTNNRDPSADAIVGATVDRAADEVESSWFPMYVQVAYDSTLTTDGAKHVAVGVMGVVALLRMWANPKSDSAAKAWAAWIEIATQGAKTFGGRKRVRPVTTSTYQHDVQDARRPEFDDLQFADHTVRAPELGDIDDD